MIGFGAGAVVALGLGPERVRRAWVASWRSGAWRSCRATCSPPTTRSWTPARRRPRPWTRAARPREAGVGAAVVAVLFALFDGGLRASAERLRRIKVLAGAGLAVLAFAGIVAGLWAMGEPASFARDKVSEFKQISGGGPLRDTAGLDRGPALRPVADRLAGVRVEPLTGVGDGSYTVRYYRDRVTEANLDDPHSEPLRVLSELGLVGCCCWWRWSPPPGWRSCAAGRVRPGRAALGVGARRVGRGPARPVDGRLAVADPRPHRARADVPLDRGGDRRPAAEGRRAARGPRPRAWGLVRLVPVAAAGLIALAFLSDVYVRSARADTTASSQERLDQARTAEKLDPLAPRRASCRRARSRSWAARRGASRSCSTCWRSSPTVRRARPARRSRDPRGGRSGWRASGTGGRSISTPATRGCSSSRADRAWLARRLPDALLPARGGGAAGAHLGARGGLADLGWEVAIHTGFPHYPAGRVMAPYRNRPLLRERGRAGERVVRSAIYPTANRGFARRLANHLSLCGVRARHRAGLGPRRRGGGREPAAVPRGRRRGVRGRQARAAGGQRRRPLAGQRDRARRAHGRAGDRGGGGARALDLPPRGGDHRAHRGAGARSRRAARGGGQGAAAGAGGRRRALRRARARPPGDGPLRVLYAGDGRARARDRDAARGRAARRAGRGRGDDRGRGRGGGPARGRAARQRARARRRPLGARCRRCTRRRTRAWCCCATGRSSPARCRPSCSSAWRPAAPRSLSARGEAAALVERSGAGLVTAPEDPVALADAFRTLHADPPCARGWAPPAGRRLERFDRPASVRAWAELLQRARR